MFSKQRSQIGQKCILLILTNINATFIHYITCDEALRSSKDGRIRRILAARREGETEMSGFQGQGESWGRPSGGGRERVAVDAVFHAVVLRKHGCRRQGGDAVPKVETGYS
jgi:hypothetical protein